MKECTGPLCGREPIDTSAFRLPPSAFRLSPSAFRLPEVAVGENQYIPYAPSDDDGSLPGILRAIAGGHVDLTDSFTDHAQYVSDVTFHARELEAGGYLLKADADAIIQRASDSDIGSP